MAENNNEPKSVAEILDEVIHEVCRNLCRYSDSTDEDFACDYIREHGSCPLSKLN